MNLRVRTFWIVSATLLVFYAVFYLISSTVFLKGFSNLEHREMQRRIDRGKKVIDSMLASQTRYTRDYANWDDTYAFIENGNPEYVRTNFPAATFENLDIDLFVYFRRDGSLFAGFRHDNGHVVKPSADWIADIRAHRRFIEVAQDVPSATGLIRVKGRPMLISAAPILNSKRRGPKRGALLTGRLLTRKRLQEAANMAGLQISLIPEANDLSLSTDTPSVIRVESEDTIAGYFLIADDMGHSVVQLRVGADRWIFQQGKASQRYLMLNLAAAAVIFVVALLVLLHRLVLARLSRLEKSLGSICDAGEPSVRLPVEGRDELGRFAAAINDALDKLEKAQAALRHDALHDPLTGLANRALFFQRAHAALRKLQNAPDATFAVLLIDIDDFKQINDNFGHEAGDDLLIRAAQCLCDAFREEDTVARLGGDEFAILLDPIREGTQAVKLAERLLENLRQPFDRNGHSLHLGASIGIAVCADPDMDVEQLVRQADMAMYSVKRYNRNGISLFDPAMG